MYGRSSLGWQGRTLFPAGQLLSLLPLLLRLALPVALPSPAPAPATSSSSSASQLTWSRVYAPSSTAGIIKNCTCLDQSYAYYFSFRRENRTGEGESGTWIASLTMQCTDGAFCSLDNQEDTRNMSYQVTVPSPVERGVSKGFALLLVTSGKGINNLFNEFGSKNGGIDDYFICSAGHVLVGFSGAISGNFNTIVNLTFACSSRSLNIIPAPAPSSSSSSSSPSPLTWSQVYAPSYPPSVTDYICPDQSYAYYFSFRRLDSLIATLTMQCTDGVTNFTLDGQPNSTVDETGRVTVPSAVNNGVSQGFDHVTVDSGAAIDNLFQQEGYGGGGAEYIFSCNPGQVLVGFRGAVYYVFIRNLTFACSSRTFYSVPAPLTPLPPPPQPPQASASAVPSPPAASGTGLIIGISVGVGAVVLLFLALLILTIIRKPQHFLPFMQRRGGSEFERKIEMTAFRKYSLSEVQLLTGGFSNDQVIGKGAYGVVYRGQFKGGQLCAVKRQLRVASGAGSAVLSEFEREIVAVSRLKHKNLVLLMGYCLEPGENVQVYEYAAEGSLDDHLHHSSEPSSGEGSRKAPLSVLQRLRIAADVAEGLQYLHSQGIVHRDIKPANILLTDSLQAKLSDFGLVKDLEETRAGATSAATRVVGTPGYLDPEYVTEVRVTKASDVYSLGVLMLELMSGRKPNIKKAADLSLVPSLWTCKASKARLHAEEHVSLNLGGGTESLDVRTEEEDEEAHGDVEVVRVFIKDFTSTLLSEGKLELLMDPALGNSQLGAMPPPSAPSAVLSADQVETLTTYYELALECLVESSKRPKLGVVCLRLQKVLQQWQACSPTEEGKEP